MKLSAAWTCQPARAAGCGGYRHFALLGLRGRGRERTLELQAVLDPTFRLLVWAIDGNGNHLWELPRDAALVSKARQAAADFLDANGADERGWNAELQRAMADAYVDLDVHSIPDLERLLVDE